MSARSQPSPVTHGWQPRSACIEEIVAEIPNVWTFQLRSSAENFPAFLPGQFNMLYAPGFGEAAISISSGVHELPRIRHTFRVVGDVTAALSRLSLGEQIGVRGPFGYPWPVDELPGNDVIIVAGGIGLAPLKPLIEHVLLTRADYGIVKLIYGARSPDELLYQPEYPRWLAAGLDMEATVDRGTPYWKGHIGVVTELMLPFAGRPDHTRLLACGPEIMMRFVAREAMSLGVSPAHIFLSLERNMKCAMGMCGVCQFGPQFVCKDGPVFSYQRVEKFLRLEDL